MATATPTQPAPQGKPKTAGASGSMNTDLIPGDESIVFADVWEDQSDGTGFFYTAWPGFNLSSGEVHVQQWLKGADGKVNGVVFTMTYQIDYDESTGAIKFAQSTVTLANVGGRKRCAFVVQEVNPATGKTGAMLHNVTGADINGELSFTG